MNRAFWINQGLFQLSWPACVIGAAYGVVWIGALVVGALAVWQLHPANRHRLDFPVLGVCVVVGLLLDTLWIRTGLLAFASPWPLENMAPAWIILLWAALALAINHSMRIFKQRLILIGILGGIGSPLSYFAGSRFGAVEWLAPAWQVVLAVGLSWAVVLPLLFWLTSPRSLPESRLVQRSSS